MRGDRDGGLAPLAGRSFDACVDVNGYVPRVVRQSVELVDAPQYVFVSSVSAYGDLGGPVSEDDATAPDVDSEDVETHYGSLKASCERVVLARDGAVTVVRPGLVVGPHDPTGRFTYWPHRIARGGDVLAPGAPDDQVQLIDVRDLGEWIVGLCERRVEGVFNAVRTTTRGELLEACVRATGSHARLRWVPTETLAAVGVGEWIELPLWLASSAHAAVMAASNERALASGLTFRPLEETARATLELAEPVPGVGLAPEREAELLRL